MKELGVSKTELHEASKVSRTTINRHLDTSGAETTTDKTYDLLFRVLDDIEADREAGPTRYVPSVEAEPFKIEMSGVYGVERVVFSGPPEDASAIQRAAVEFVRQIQAGKAAEQQDEDPSD